METMGYEVEPVKPVQNECAKPEDKSEPEEERPLKRLKRDRTIPPVPVFAKTHEDPTPEIEDKKEPLEEREQEKIPVP